MVILHILLVLTLQLSGTSAVCNTSWFGPECKFRCRCTGDKCNDEGACMDTSTCDSFWFGPGCQFRNLVQEHGGSESLWATDQKSATCQPNKDNPEPVSIVFKIMFQFLWLRLTVLMEAALNVTFNMGTLPCTFQRVYMASNTEIDVTCGQPSEVGEVSIHGEILKYLCEVYVSGGENMAIKQFTNQTSHLSWGVLPVSGLAVDGNADSNYFRSFSCAHTNEHSTVIPIWNVFFNQPKMVHRIHVVGRNKYFGRLSGFILTTYDPNNKILETYREPGLLQEQYDVFLKKTTELMSRVSIVLINNELILALCEVETFGQRICPRGKWGFACEKDCKCHKSQSCFVPTGACTVGCPVGFYGPACNMRCSINCDDTGCSEDLGICYGCDDGYTGAKCNQACPSGKYGTNCLMKCSPSCSESRCHHVTGGCLSCPVGYFGPQCLTQCPPECGSGGCHAHNGRCMSCPTGLYKETCSAKCIKDCTNVGCNQDTGYCGTDCPPKTFGDKCLLNCSEHCETCNNARCLKCEIGYYGDMCSYACPEICEEISCGLKTRSSAFSGLVNEPIKILATIFGGALLLITVFFITAILLCRNTSSDENDAKQATPKYH